MCSLDALVFIPGTTASVPCFLQDSIPWAISLGHVQIHPRKSKIVSVESRSRWRQRTNTLLSSSDTTDDFIRLKKSNTIPNGLSVTFNSITVTPGHLVACGGTVLSLGLKGLTKEHPEIPGRNRRSSPGTSLAQKSCKEWLPLSPWCYMLLSHTGRTFPASCCLPIFICLKYSARVIYFWNIFIYTHKV